MEEELTRSVQIESGINVVTRKQQIVEAIDLPLRKAVQLIARL
jgi:hypothetical protein